MFSFAAVIFFYCALKVRDRSPLGLLLSSIFLLTIPVSLWILGKFQLAAAEFVSFDKLWFEPTIILSVFIFAALVIRRKEFNREGKPLKIKYKRMLLIFFVLFSLPTMLVAGYIKYFLATTDHDFALMQQKTDFYLYRPTYFPDNRVHEQNYYVNEGQVVSQEKTIQVVLNYPASERLEGKRSGQITLAQTGVDSAFDIHEYLESELGSREAEVIESSIGKNNIIYFHEEEQKKDLFIHTPKDTFLIIKAFYIEYDELIKFAENLE